jgi:hypothetical protein
MHSSWSVAFPMSARFAHLLCSVALAGCTQVAAHQLDAGVSHEIDLSGIDFDLPACRKRIAETLATPAAPGAPEFDRTRAAFLGRAYGEPLLFVAAPAKPARDWSDGFTDGLRLAVDFRPRVKLITMMKQTKKADLRRAVLRDGYVYADNPHAAFALVRELTYADLFDDPVVHVERGAERFRLARDATVRPAIYRHDDGRLKGHVAKLFFGDRAASEEVALANPLHRDVRELRARVGFDRFTPEHVTSGAIVANLRFGDQKLRALFTSQGAKLELDCVEAAREDREKLVAHAAKTAWRRRAIASLQRAVDAAIGEELPFDRPYDVKHHLDDGKLRPSFDQAYRLGHSTYGLGPEGHSYYVFDPRGRPLPPETCVAMIVDCFERASGTWYRPLGQPRERTRGGLDFHALKLFNRSGVLAFEQFGVEHPELFKASRFVGAQRIPFQERDKFFDFLLANADRFAPGDVLAIQGPKPDGYVHQHAILLEDVDPITGFPYGLADQMKRPRRRTWEGIMGEAPLRALLYQLKPTDELLARVDPGPEG